MWEVEDCIAAAGGTVPEFPCATSCLAHTRVQFLFPSTLVARVHHKYSGPREMVRREQDR